MNTQVTEFFVDEAALRFVSDTAKQLAVSDSFRLASVNSDVLSLTDTKALTSNTVTFKSNDYFFGYFEISFSVEFEHKINKKSFILTSSSAFTNLKLHQDDDDLVLNQAEIEYISKSLATKFYNQILKEVSTALVIHAVDEIFNNNKQ